MPRSRSGREWFGATQQTLRSTGSSVGGRMVSVGRARAALVLLGVVLLCGAAVVREFEITIRDRHVEASASTVRVKRGEIVLLRWRTDEAVSLHVHGYDVRANATAAAPATMRFDAGVAGRFPITAHAFGGAVGPDARPKSHREVTLLYLEVLPE